MKNKLETYKYYVIRGQKRYINKKKEQLIKIFNFYEFFGQNKN